MIKKGFFMLEVVKTKIKELIGNKEIGIFTTDREVLSAVRNILAREMGQMNKMRQDVLQENKNYKLNLSQLYFTRYSSKNNDVNLEVIKMYLHQSKLFSYKEIKTLSNKEIIIVAIKSIEIEELNKNRVEKFIMESSKIIDVFKLNETNKLDLMKESQKNLFSQYIDSFNKGNKKIEEHLK
jgi:hypothetical protein